MSLKQESLEYHRTPPSGKLEIVPTKKCQTQHDLSLAYTPGVAQPCLEIEADPKKAYEYTTKGNLVAIITNGTAVLGLGDIGPLAAKPVMEGKSLLFKRFADVNAIDIELDIKDPDRLIETVSYMEPSFGGINLEDIRAPECFYIEQSLKSRMSIPVFHDDQHGTAIIAGAALINALELIDKRISDIRIVLSGAGAAAIATAHFFTELGAKQENLIFCDRQGVIYKGRTENMNIEKEKLAIDTPLRSLADALAGADVFMGLSAKGLLTGEMIKPMAKNPIVFALANPDPEITPEEAKGSRPDVIMATGRSDYPNQVNNVLGFPFIFRGALDVRAREINEAMKIAASKALAELAKEPALPETLKAYHLSHMELGKDYLIPKPVDPRVLLRVSPAVALAAIATGVAGKDIELDSYHKELEDRLVKCHNDAARIVSGHN